MRLKTLNGAPLREHLNWNDNFLLTPEECESSMQAIISHPADTSTMQVKWRRLEAPNTRLRSGWSQPYLPASDLGHEHLSLPYSAYDASTQSMRSMNDKSRLDDTSYVFEDDPTVGDGFLEHSLILHDTLLSSQIALDTSQDKISDAGRTISPSSFLSTSFETTRTDFSDFSEEDSQDAVLQLSPKLTITSLANLPSATHLRAIYPQTPTPTFLCVLTTQPEIREVYVRKGGYNMNVFEILVADETRSGFKVSFWFRPGQVHLQSPETVRRILEGIEVGDILLLRNVVLNTFRENVYGQSLSPNIRKAKTTVEVLAKHDGSAGYKHIVPLLADEKFLQVKQWAKVHIVSGLLSKRKRNEQGNNSHNKSQRTLGSHGRAGDSLPPDTMEST